MQHVPGACLRIEPLCIGDGSHLLQRTQLLFR